MREKKTRTPVFWLGTLTLVCFGILFLRLLYIQAFSYQEYSQKKEDYVSIKQYISAPRGQIFDTKGNVLAKTVISHNVVFTSPNNFSLQDYLLYAERLRSVLNVSLEGFSKQEQKDGYLTYVSLLDTQDPKYQGRDLISGEDWSDWSTQERETYVRSRLDDKTLNSIPVNDLIQCMIYNRMIAGLYDGQQQVILEDVEDDTISYLVEHRQDFPGFSIDFGGWKREYPYGDSLRDILGSVSTSTQGLPSELADYYLSRGFHMNSQVGLSGLEYQYNDLLYGTEQVLQITYESNGLANKKVIQRAKKGYDLYLSIDMELQETVDETLKQVLETYGASANRDHFETLFMSLMDPETGGILAMGGYQMDPDTRKLSYFGSGNYKTLINPGSAIKGATLYMGLKENVVKEGEVILDAPMDIGGRLFSSYENHGYVDDVSALAVSSNIYMFQIGLRLAQGSYREGELFSMEDPAKTLSLMRSYYSSFGLGVSSGLDVPDEVSGFQGTNQEPGMVLNFSIGQYDMYTPLQLLVYTSAIANGGTVLKPSLMSHVNEVNSQQPVLSADYQEYRLLNSKKALERVQKGFAACVTGGNCYTPIQEVGAVMAAKTGTAEVGEWTTANFVGYGPVNKPSVAFACSAPTSSVNSQSVSENVCAAYVAGPILSRYFELYPPEEISEKNEEEPEKTISSTVDSDQ